MSARRRLRNRRRRDARLHVPASTVMAAEYLIGQNDPDRLRAWLANHTRRERLAIRQYFERRK